MLVPLASYWLGRLPLRDICYRGIAFDVGWYFSVVTVFLIIRDCVLGCGRITSAAAIVAGSYLYVAIILRLYFFSKCFKSVANSYYFVITFDIIVHHIYIVSKWVFLL